MTAASTEPHVKIRLTKVKIDGHHTVKQMEGKEQHGFAGIDNDAITAVDSGRGSVLTTVTVVVVVVVIILVRKEE